MCRIYRIVQEGQNMDSGPHLVQKILPQDESPQIMITEVPESPLLLSDPIVEASLPVLLNPLILFTDHF